MGKYKGPKLTGALDFSLWMKELDSDLKANNLFKHVDGRAKRPDLPVLEEGATAAQKKTWGKALWERDSFDAESESVITKLLQSIDTVHKSMVVELETPKEMRDRIVLQYSAANKSRLRRLVRGVFSVSTDKNLSVQEKVDRLRNYNAEIRLQKPSIAFHDDHLIQFLLSSMSESYEGIVDNLNSKEEELTLEMVQRALLSKETELNDRGFIKQRIFRRPEVETFKFNLLPAEVQLLILELTLETDNPTVDPDMSGPVGTNDLIPTIREDLAEQTAHRAHIIHVLRVNKMFRSEGIQILLRRHSVAFSNGPRMRNPSGTLSYSWGANFLAIGQAAYASCLSTQSPTTILSYSNLKFVEIRFIWAQFDRERQDWEIPEPGLFKLACRTTLTPACLGYFPNLERYTIDLIDSPKVRAELAEIHSQLWSIADHFHPSWRTYVAKIPEIVIKGLPSLIERKMVEEFRAFLQPGGRIGVSRSYLRTVPGKFELRRIQSKGTRDFIEWIKEPPPPPPPNP